MFSRLLGEGIVAAGIGLCLCLNSCISREHERVMQPTQAILQREESRDESHTRYILAILQIIKYYQKEHSLRYPRDPQSYYLDQVESVF